MAKEKRHTGPAQLSDLPPSWLALSIMSADNDKGTPTVQGFHMAAFKKRAIGNEFDKLKRQTGTQQSLMDGLNLRPIEKRLATPIGNLVDTILLQIWDNFFNKAVHVFAVLIWRQGAR